ncbi:MAG: ankyrin repeat domain-containing protein [Bacteroidales bacterium]|nr:ankyrin repeat domain-containing protein [Bacteroidales bacterium]
MHFKLKIIHFIGFLFIINCLSVYSQDTLSQEELNYNLLMAAYYGKSDSIVYWINMGADVNATSNNGVTALTYAIQSQNIDAVKALILNGANINYFDYTNLPPIFLAVAYNQKPILSFLISKGAQVDITIKKRINLLHYAAKYSDSSLFRYIFTKFPTLFTSKDEDGNTPLMAIVYFKRYDLIPIVCNYINPNEHRDEYGISPLLFSVINNDTLMANKLISCGIPINEKSLNGYGIVEYAVIKKDKELLEWAIRNTKHNENIHYPVKLAYSTENRQLAKIFRKSGYKAYLFPVFSRINIGHSHIFSGNDYMIGFNMQVTEYNYGFRYAIDFHTRPWANRIYLQTNETNTLLQVWERRSLWSFQLTKHMLLYKNNDFSCHILVGAKGYVTYGKYRGFEHRPPSYTLLSPSTCLYFQWPDVALSIGAEYFKFRNINAQSLHITFAQYFSIPLKHLYYQKKQISW